MVGDEYVGRNLKVMAADGKLVNIAYLHGSKVEVDLMPLMLKRLTITGSTLRTRSVNFEAAIGANLKKKIWRLIAAVEISPFIYATFSWVK